MNIYVTQRVDLFPPHNEKRDSLDSKWYPLLKKLNVTPILIPNDITLVKKIISEVKYDALLLTGGNTLSHLDGGDAPERDEVERLLIESALEKKNPIIGVCRGFHMVQHYLKGEIISLNGYAGVEHDQYIDGVKGRSVVTHCNYGFKNTEMKIISVDENDVVLSAVHQKFRIYGQLWHPERDVNASDENIKTLTNFLENKNE